VVLYSNCKAWNRNFAANAHARLPHELRDMIYQYLLDEDDFGHSNFNYLYAVVSRREATSQDFDDTTLLTVFLIFWALNA
jgi:hypothetical protein